MVLPDRHADGGTALTGHHRFVLLFVTAAVLLLMNM